MTDSTAGSAADPKSIASLAPATPTGLKKETTQLAVPMYPVSIDSAVPSVQEKRRVLLGNATARDEKEALLRVASMWTDVVAQTPAGLVKFLPPDAKQTHEQEHYYEMLEIVIQKRLASAGQGRRVFEPKYEVACDGASEAIQQERIGLLSCAIAADNEAALKLIASEWKESLHSASAFVRKCMPADAIRQFEVERYYDALREAVKKRTVAPQPAPIVSAAVAAEVRDSAKRVGRGERSKQDHYGSGYAAPKVTPETNADAKECVRRVAMLKKSSRAQLQAVDEEVRKAWIQQAGPQAVEEPPQRFWEATYYNCLESLYKKRMNTSQPSSSAAGTTEQHSPGVSVDQESMGLESLHVSSPGVPRQATAGSWEHISALKVLQGGLTGTRYIFEGFVTHYSEAPREVTARLACETTAAVRKSSGADPARDRCESIRLYRPDIRFAVGPHV